MGGGSSRSASRVVQTADNTYGLEKRNMGGAAHARPLPDDTPDTTPLIDAHSHSFNRDVDMSGESAAIEAEIRKYGECDGHGNALSREEVSERQYEKNAEMSHFTHEPGVDDEMADREHDGGELEPDSRPLTPLSQQQQYEDGMECDEMYENRASWDMITNSLGMDGDDLLFNMLYFSGEGENLNFGNVLNNAMEETVALHSDQNTPYKLRPASAGTMAGLSKFVEKFTLEEEGQGAPRALQGDTGNTGMATALDSDVADKCVDPAEAKDHGRCQDQDSEENFCLVCRDDLVVGDTIVRLPVCRHRFHAECLERWFKMQNWCPVCRTTLGGVTERTTSYSAAAASCTEGKSDDDIDGDNWRYLRGEEKFDKENAMDEDKCGALKEASHDKHEERNGCDDHLARIAQSKHNDGTVHASGFARACEK